MPKKDKAVMNDYIIVTRYDNVQNGKQTRFKMPEVNNNLGIVKESGDPDFKPGDKIYFLSKLERVTLASSEQVLVMKADNILKKVESDETT